VSLWNRSAPNTRWSRQRLSALVVSRPFGFVGILVQCGSPAHPALRLSFSVGRLSKIVEIG
jgi:hypothetical protein